MVSAGPSEGERYYLRILLNHMKAPKSYEDMRTVNGEKYPTFREAAFSRGLLESDNDISESLCESCSFQMPYALRRLFAIILYCSSPSDPKGLWDEFKDELAGDFINDGAVPRHSVFDKTLHGIDIFLQSMGSSIDQYHLVSYNISATAEEYGCRERENERAIVVSNEDLLLVNELNDDQRTAFDAIISSAKDNNGRAFFLDGPGGAGKTFLYRALLAHVRSKGDFALAVASSGVGASLLPGGRTAHSRFKLPVEISNSMSCNINKPSSYAKFIASSKLIIWDEAPMSHLMTIKALDMLLQDLCNSS